MVARDIGDFYGSGGEADTKIVEMMLKAGNMKILITDLDQGLRADVWNAYLAQHEYGSLYVMAQWCDVIRDVYGHRGIHLVAVEKRKGVEEIVGVLPLVNIRSRIFGNKLVSMPYFDMAGVVSDSSEIEKILLFKALELGRDFGVACVEVRQGKELSSLEGKECMAVGNRKHTLTVMRDKERMLLSLPASSGALWTSFKSKLRSQISRAMKGGLMVYIGDGELVDTFYSVFAENMRDLGSPVHAKKLFHQAMKAFKGRAKIVVVKKDGVPVSASMVCGYGETLQNPWASSLRRYSRLSPNMLLYWRMLEYACDNGYTTFDFGRSTPGEGTYRFKKQWGAEPFPLHWYRFTPDGVPVSKGRASERDRFCKVMTYWQKMPVSLTKLVGPLVRGQISL